MSLDRTAAKKKVANAEIIVAPRDARNKDGVNSPQVFFMTEEVKAPTRKVPSHIIHKSTR